MKRYTYLYIYLTFINILPNYYIIIGNCMKNILSLSKERNVSIITDWSEINSHIVLFIVF